MAENNEIIIDVKVNTSEVEQKLSAAIHSLAAMKEEQKRLTKEIQAGNDVNGTYARQLVNVQRKIEENNRAIKSNTAILQAEKIARVDNTQSLDDQRQALNTLQKAYAQLSGEEKEAADQQGGLRDQIKALNDSVLEQEQAIGDSRRNVGNYSESITDAFGKMAGAGELMGPAIGLLGGMGAEGQKAAKVMTMLQQVMQLVGKSGQTIAASQQAARAATTAQTAAQGAQTAATTAQTAAQTTLNAVMAANPIGLIIAGISAVLPLIQLFIGSTNDAEEAQEAFNAEMDNYNRKLSERERLLSNEIRMMELEGATSIEVARRQKKAAVEELKRAVKMRDEVAAQYKEALYDDEDSELTEELGKQYDELNDLVREKLTALKQAKDDIRYEERKAEKEAQEESKAAAEKALEERRLLEEKEAEKRQKAAEQREKLLADQRALLVARTRTALENEIATLEEARQKELAIEGLTKEELIAIEEYYNERIADARAKNTANALEEEAKKLQAKKDARVQFGLDPEKTPEEQELELLQQAREQDLLNAEEYEIAKGIIQKKYTDERTAELQESVKVATELYEQEMMTATSSTGAALTALGELIGAFAGESEEAAKVQKAFALGSILINQAMSIAEGAKGIAAAMAGAAAAAAATGPAAPIMLGVYQAQMVGQALAMVSSVASSIVQAKQLFAEGAQKFATGGIVSGTSYTGDKVPAMLNSREMVLNMSQQKELFAALNGGGGAIGMDYSLLATAIASQPAPVVVYSELQSFGDKVANYNEIASI